MIFGLLAAMVSAAACLLLIHVAWHDFFTLRVHNNAVLALVGLYVIWAALNGFETFAGDLAIGIILFAIGFAMWLAGAMGGGDVKLYFALGLFVGFETAGLFVILLLVMSLLFVAVLSVFGRARPDAAGRVARRLRHIKASGKVPYAVPMCFAAIPAIAVRIAQGA